MVVSNPRLSGLITSAIGEDWVTDLNKLRKLEPLAEDAAFCEKWQEVKFDNKQDVCTMFSCDQAVRV